MPVRRASHKQRSGSKPFHPHEDSSRLGQKTTIRTHGLVMCSYWAGPAVTSSVRNSRGHVIPSAQDREYLSFKAPVLLVCGRAVLELPAAVRGEYVFKTVS